MLVVVGHTIIFWGRTAHSSPPIPFCVDLFFLLSGFVIAFAYEPRFAGGHGRGDFLRQRFVRLYPLYFLGIVLGLPSSCSRLTTGDARSRAPSLMRSSVRSCSCCRRRIQRLGRDLYPLNMPAWTLLFELLANIIYVLALSLADVDRAC